MQWNVQLGGHQRFQTDGITWFRWGFTKFPCCLCLWKAGTPRCWGHFAVGRKNIKWKPLVNLQKVLMIPLQKGYWNWLQRATETMSHMSQRTSSFRTSYRSRLQSWSMMFLKKTNNWNLCWAGWDFEDVTSSPYFYGSNQYCFLNQFSAAFSIKDKNPPWSLIHLHWQKATLELSIFVSRM